MAQKKPSKNSGTAAAAVKPLTDEEIDQKVKELLSKMSLEEKVGQMTQVNLNTVLVGDYKNMDGKIDAALLKKAVVEYKVGSILNAINHAYSVEDWHKIITQIQDAAKQTPNNIPVIYGIDAIHGVTFTLNSTLFPQSISMAATRNTELAKIAGEITAKETRASGIRWNFAPVLDVGRQPLWPRFEETYGEDVYLVKQMGVASISGMEGDGNLQKIDKVASCMKHFIGYSLPVSGKDRTPAYIPQGMLREYFLPPFKAAVDAGASTLMINSGELNGIPVHGSKFLLTDVLRKELNFKGLAVSDWEDIIRLHTKHKVAQTPKEAVMMAVNAGVDMSMVPHDFSFYELLIENVKDGGVSQARIDEAVSRILTLKFRLGLFQNPYPEKEATKQFGLPQYKTAALESAREVITLLKNKENILPLPKGKKILVTGPAAKSVTALNGSWSYTWQGNDPKWYPDTNAHILKAVQQKNTGGQVIYSQGSQFDLHEINIKETVEQAKNVDYVVVCIGEDAYAESPGVIDELELPEVQQKLVTALYQTGKPVILVLVEGRPRIIRKIEEGAKGILMAYVPGSQGHTAIAEVLFGEVNPSGKLPFTYPKYSGDIVLYDHKYSDKVTELSAGVGGEGGYKPQWPFGYGLSYTTFEYSNLKLDTKTMKGSGTVKVSVEVKNTGSRAGKEAIELYTRDHFASVTPNSQRLRKFKKITLNPGQSVTVDFILDKNDLAFIGTDEKTFVTEPGGFDVMIDVLKESFNYED